LQKYNIFADLQQMFVISLSSFVIQQEILVLKISVRDAIHDRPPDILRSVMMTTHSTPLVSHARDN
jgi:hypothetical protein